MPGPFVALVGEFDPAFRPHQATDAAIRHAEVVLGVRVRAEWISTSDLDEFLLERANGLWIAPGSPYRDLKRTLNAIRFARENGVPCLGTCGGFQHMVLEYARNVLGFQDAAHAEYDPYSSDLFISALQCSLAGRTMKLAFAPDSIAAQCYGSNTAEEEYYCNFGVNPDRLDLFKSADLRIVGWDAEGEMRVVELVNHPFFVGTLFVPQTKSRPGAPHPLVTQFLKSANAFANRRAA